MNTVSKKIAIGLASSAFFMIGISSPATASIKNNDFPPLGQYELRIVAGNDKSGNPQPGRGTLWSWLCWDDKANNCTGIPSRSIAPIVEAMGPTNWNDGLEIKSIKLKYIADSEDSPLWALDSVSLHATVDDGARVRYLATTTEPVTPHSNAISPDSYLVFPVKMEAVN